MKVNTRKALVGAAGLALAVALSSPLMAGDEKSEAPMAFDTPPAAGTQASCPVSKDVFEVKAGTERSEHGGKHYVFCCPGCKPKFDEEPHKYVQDEGHAGDHGSEGHGHGKHGHRHQGGQHEGHGC